MEVYCVRKAYIISAHICITAALLAFGAGATIDYDIDGDKVTITKRG